MFTIDVEWFKVWKRSRYPIFDPELGVFVSFYSPHFFRSGDRPEDDGYSCALVFGIFEPAAQDVINQGITTTTITELKDVSFMGKYKPDYAAAFNKGYNVILLSVLPLMKVNASQLIKYIESLQNDYLNTSSKKSYNDRSPHFMINPTLDKSHTLLISDLCKKVPSLNVRPFFFKDHGNNLDELLSIATPLLTAGKVWVCTHPNDPEKLRNMDAGMLEVLSGYPSTQSTSMTWALCQALIQLQLEGIFDKEQPAVYKEFKGVKLF